MSQSKVTSFYALRKNTRSQTAKTVDFQFNDGDKKSRIQNLPVFSQELKPHENVNEKTEKIHKSFVSAITTKDNVVQKTTKRQPQQKAVKRVIKSTKQSSKKGSKAKQQELSQPKVTTFYESSQKCDYEKDKNSDLNLVSEAVPVKVSEVEDSAESSEKSAKTTQEEILQPQAICENAGTCQDACKDTSENLNSISKELFPVVDINIVKDSVCDIVSDRNNVKEEECVVSSKSNAEVSNTVPPSPKRNLINSLEGTPPKKKTLVGSEKDARSELSPFRSTPRKLIFESSEEVFKSSEESIAKQKKLPFQNESKELKKLVANFKNKIAQIRNYESNPYKPTSVISPAKEIDKTPSVPSVPAHHKYSYLIDPSISSSLLLPQKYKVLSEMFRSFDTVVNILNNRKEKITFEKVQEGVQKMMKRNFSKAHFGQILTVMPHAFDVNLEKCNFKKANEPNYELIISPFIKKDKNDNKESKSSNFMTVKPQDLFHRKKQFDRNLFQLVYNYHETFLNQKHCPSIAIESLTRWHPKFPLDSVPDVKVASLPEIPENKINSAKDVLNKMIKGPLQNKEKVVKALKEVAEESSSDKKIETKTVCSKTPPPTKSALKGVCPDLIAKIRARESAKFLECMTQSPNEVQRKAMLERLPKIMQILWHYFIAERKAAVHVDTAIEKIVHSLNSLSSHEEIKAHLTLITEEFPGWLSFVQFRKGLYITMDKNKNLNEMLKNFSCK